MVNVYITDIRQWNDEMAYRKWLATVPDDRRLRAESYKQTADQRRSLAGSILVCRAFAKRYPDVDVCTLHFGARVDGKPYIEEYPTFHFCISHSGDYAVCAVSEREVGIDIQQIQNMRAGIAERFFSEREKAQIEAVAEAEGTSEMALAKRQKMFFRIWSAKEAYVKLTGEGLKEFKCFTADLANECICLRESTSQAEIPVFQSGDAREREKLAKCVSHRCHDLENVYLKEYEAVPDYVLTVCAYEQAFGDVQIYRI